MHICIRVCAKMVQAFKRYGSFFERPKPFDWEKLWLSTISDYEKSYNARLWCTIYYKGRPIFESGERHPFVDVIEKFDSDNSEHYEASISMAENAFKKTGKDLKISYNGNVALVIDLEERSGRCSIIFRGAMRTTTFTFSATPKMESLDFNYGQCLSATAAFLEAIQIAFMIGMNEEKLCLGQIARHSAEHKQTKMARRRLSFLSSEIVNFERAYAVRYRPERPEFSDIILDAGEVARSLFEDGDA